MRPAAISPTSRVATIAGWTALGSILALAVSGIWLWFFYQPSAALAWDDIEALQGGIGTARSVQRLHSFLVLPALLATLVWSVLALASQRDRGSGIAVQGTAVQGTAGLTMMILLVGAGISGLVLPWDQLALNSVTVGTGITGYTRLWADQDVAFVLVDGQVVTTAWLRGWLVAHVGSGAVAALLLAGWLALRGRAGPVARTPGSPSGLRPAARGLPD